MPKLGILAVFGCCLSSTLLLADWTGAPSPHNGTHLVVWRANDLVNGSGKSVVTMADAEASTRRAAQVTEPLGAMLQIQHPGKYHVWVRLASETEDVAIRYEFMRGEESLLKGDIRQLRGPEHGGPSGHQAYAAEALKSAPGSKAGGGSLAALDGEDAERAKASDAAAEFGQELLDDLNREQGGPQTGRWIRFTRLETPKDPRPYYWWKLGALELTAGEYRLNFQRASAASAERPVSVDLGFLTTSDEITYPYEGDVSAPPASYVRFRLEDVPEGGVTIGASMRIHYDPWSTGSVSLGADGMKVGKAAPHTKPGFTPWYRLQDIERAPAFGRAEAHLLLQVGPRETGKLPRGATQFAVFPHDDYVLREISWNEPEGTRISLVTDFAAAPEKLRTFRDHARENYDDALAATAGRMAPLTRGDLYFGNAWGHDNGDSAQYMVKTLRLLGFNCVSDASDPVANRARYGWTSHAGQYWPPAFLPFNEDEARQKYADHYRGHFDKQREFYEGVTIYQVADEPGEISRAEMSSPLWRFQGEDDEKFADMVGDGILATRRSDYENCVLEGRVEKHGGWFGFRVGADHPTEPEQYLEWRLGKVAYGNELNLATNRVGIASPGTATSTRPGAAIAAKPTSFKIVYQGQSAALYVGGKLIQTQQGLPPRGGFAFAGPAKAVCELKFRRIASSEKIVSGDPDLKLTKADKTDDLLDDINELVADSKQPAWMESKPLRKMIDEDWIIGGGMPEAQAGFRRWVQRQGLEPALFGKASWDDVHMLTVPSLVESPADARLFYWSRRYSGYLTPRMFALAADAIQQNAPNPEMKGFVALSGHALYFPSAMPLDMFQLASGSSAMMPGVSDWMSYGGWRWDSHQAVAYSVAMYNAGARRYDAPPTSFPMMHCVWPSELRAMTMLANNVRYVSYYNFGPYYQVTEGFWSESPGCYTAAHRVNNRAAQVDDILANAEMRPSRVAMLYSIANEYWDPQSSFADKRATFLALSHEYLQPELVTEEQIAAGALKHYDALLVLDPVVATAAQENIAEWVHRGGLLWAAADAALRNEFNEPGDLLSRIGKIHREFRSDDVSADEPIEIKPIEGQAAFRAHTVNTAGMPDIVTIGDAKVRAKFSDGRPAWVETPVGAGRVVYVAHRVGLTYTSKAIRTGGYPVIWADTGRELVTAPLLEAEIERELTLSEPVVMASPMSSKEGTVVILYNMRAKPLKDVDLSLREPARPHSAARVTATGTEPLAFEYHDGRVKLTLPELNGGEMIVVRRNPAPADNRLEKMREKTVEQLASDDWKTLAAGAWFAGFHPEWELGGRLIPLLKHDQWDVRRAAVEALGRLVDPSAGDAVTGLIRRETDSHVLGDAIVALARLGDSRAGPIVLESLTHADPFVRRQAIESLTIYAERAPSGQQDAVERLALEAADIGLEDVDSRVRRGAMHLVARFDPQAAIERATSTKTLHDRSLWIEAVAVRDRAWDEYKARGLPGGDEVVLAFAALRSDPKVAAALTARCEAMARAHGSKLVRAAMRQGSSNLALRLFQHRNDLPPTVKGLLPIVMENSFDARIGHDVEDWAEYLKSR